MNHERIVAVYRQNGNAKETAELLSIPVATAWRIISKAIPTDERRKIRDAHRLSKPQRTPRRPERTKNAEARLNAVLGL